MVPGRNILEYDTSMYEENAESMPGQLEVPVLVTSSDEVVKGTVVTRQLVVTKLRSPNHSGTPNGRDSNLTFKHTS